jgi:hypothetical protein
MFFEAGGADWMPTSWFLALFERVRGAAQPELAARAGRAVLATATALAGAVLVSIAGFKRQSQRALAPYRPVREQEDQIDDAFSVTVPRYLANWSVFVISIACVSTDHTHLHLETHSVARVALT